MWGFGGLRMNSSCLFRSLVLFFVASGLMSYQSQASLKSLHSCNERSSLSSSGQMEPWYGLRETIV